jgi:hypothetical protein
VSLADYEHPEILPQGPGPDPFDLESLRLAPAEEATVEVSQALLTIPVRKPDKSWFVRVHPDPACRIQTNVIELTSERTKELYLVDKSLWPALAAEPTFRPKLLVTAMSRQNLIFLWELNLPRPGSRVDGWTASALEAVKLATTKWIRIAANMANNGYDVVTARGQLPEPRWPQLAFSEVIRLGFRDRFITDLNHTVLRRLRGEE